MKTAKQYIIDVMGYDTPSSRIDMVDALAAVQAALDDAGTVGTQVTAALSSFFAELPAPPLPLPREMPALRRGCYRCGKAACNCEQPPF